MEPAIRFTNRYLHMGSALKQVVRQFSSKSLSYLFSGSPHSFQLKLWDGSAWGERRDPRFVLLVKHPRAFEQLFRSPSELSLGESYVRGDLEIEGDIQAAVEVGDYLISNPKEALPLSFRLAGFIRQFPKLATDDRGSQAHLAGELHSKERDRRAISYHYDLPPEFFSLWLDQRMIYSCAYFQSREENDLDAAQYRKLDYLCKKLRLQAGETLLDIGCGWGGLLIFAARHYKVRALGITLSVPQAETARQRIRELGLNDHCRVEVCDYRDLSVDQDFDKVVSVGMFEHVGDKQLPVYFSRVWHLLRPGGAFLNTGIAASATYERKGPSFIDEYVFPDGDLVPISRALDVAERCGFELLDVESLREHYALTLDQWVRRLEAQATRAKELTGETTYRIWRLYMAATAHAFREARMNLYHVLLAKTNDGNTGFPLTRADWYCSAAYPSVRTLKMRSGRSGKM